MSDKEVETEQSILTLMIEQVGLTSGQAQRCLDEAKLKIEAVAMVGVAGFWS